MPRDPDAGTTRREFLIRAGAIATQFGLLAALPSPASGFARRRTVVAREPWADVEELADGVWAVVSKPLEDRTTLCNGGIIRGDDRVLVVESFASAEGAAWVGRMARELAGRGPDLVVITHYHGDHAAGLAGFAVDAPAPEVRITERTRELVQAQDARRDAGPVKARMLADGAVIDAMGEAAIDLGGRVVRLVPRVGHTASDVTVHVDDARVVFCGDLVWNRYFPNYVDAIPSRLADAMKELHAEDDGTTFVSGHGPIASYTDLARYIALIHYVEDAAREAARTGMTAAEAAARLSLPPGLGDWHLFSPRYFEVAIGAWLKELGAGA